MYINNNGIVSGGFQGLYIYTSGEVKLAYIEAHSNDNTGIQINNAYSPSAPKNVAINDVRAMTTMAEAWMSIHTATSLSKVLNLMETIVAKVHTWKIVLER